MELNPRVKAALFIAALPRDCQQAITTCLDAASGQILLALGGQDVTDGDRSAVRDEFLALARRAGHEVPTAPEGFLQWCASHPGLAGALLLQGWLHLPPPPGLIRCHMLLQRWAQHAGSWQSSGSEVRVDISPTLFRGGLFVRVRGANLDEAGWISATPRGTLVWRELPAGRVSPARRSDDGGLRCGRLRLSADEGGPLHLDGTPLQRVSPDNGPTLTLALGLHVLADRERLARALARRSQDPASRLASLLWREAPELPPDEARVELWSGGMLREAVSCTVAGDAEAPERMQRAMDAVLARAGRLLIGPRVFGSYSVAVPGRDAALWQELTARWTGAELSRSLQELLEEGVPVSAAFLICDTLAGMGTRQPESIATEVRQTLSRQMWALASRGETRPVPALLVDLGDHRTRRAEAMQARLLGELSRTLGEVGDRARAQIIAELARRKGARAVIFSPSLPRSIAVGLAAVAPELVA
ncbi:MAG: hypothetical protein ACYCW6_26880, partial [Candidatus Xenobia bacterium]